MLADLDELSFELDGFVFGEGTSFRVTNIEYSSDEVIVSDKPLPRSDGVRFGTDFRGGLVITFRLVVLGEFKRNSADALDLLGQLKSVWLADQVRAMAGRTSLLRMNRSGRTRRVYGRPRRFGVEPEQGNSGLVFALADFQAIDNLFYGDGEHSNTVSIIPPPAGGLVAPLAAPLSTIAVSYEPGVITVGGNVDAWMVILIRGPITNPSVRVVDGWTLTLNLTLRAGETVGVDPRPWSRGIRKDGLANVAGTLDWASPRLSDVRLAPGTHEVVLSGQDITGTASMTVAWRESWSSY